MKVLTLLVALIGLNCIAQQQLDTIKVLNFNGADYISIPKGKGVATKFFKYADATYNFNSVNFYLQFFDSKNQLRREGTYYGSGKNGKFISYDSLGRVTEIQFFLSGKRKSKLFSKQEFYHYNLAIGIWKTYQYSGPSDRTGYLIKEIEYYARDRKHAYRFYNEKGALTDAYFVKYKGSRLQLFGLREYQKVI